MDIKINIGLKSEFSKKEIIQHNSKSDCWVILFNQVYDITDFIKKHPGGADILFCRAGEDASSFFQTRHGRNSPYLKFLEQYKIGVVVESEKVEEDAFDEPFLDELIKTCQKKNLFKVNRKKLRKFNLIRTFLLLIFAICLTLVFFLNIPWIYSIPLVILQAFVSTSLFGLVAHEHTHSEFPKNKVLKFLLKLTWPIFWPFISREALIYEHNSHHIKIGDPDYDYEVIGFSHFIRYSSEVPFKPIHKIQHRISILWYMFYANIITTIGGTFSKFWSQHNKKVALKHSLSVLLTLLVYILIPYGLHKSFWHFTLLYLIYQCTLYIGVYLGAAINHFTPLAFKKIPEEMNNKFGYYVCHNTSNFSPNSSFWFYFTGGFNIQIEHHLSAFVPVENLRELQPIVKNLCRKYNYPYFEYSSIFDLYSDHIKYLKVYSQEKTDTFSYEEMKNKTHFQPR